MRRAHRRISLRIRRIRKRATFLHASFQNEIKRRRCENSGGVFVYPLGKIPRRHFCVPERESFALSRQIADFPALTKLRINLRYGHYESITIRRRTSVRRRDGIFMNASELIFSRRGFGKLFAAFLGHNAEKFRVGAEAPSQIPHRIRRRSGTFRPHSAI